HVRQEDRERVFGEVAGAIGRATDDLNAAARAGAGGKRDRVSDGVGLDLSAEYRIEHRDEAAAEREVDVLQPQVVDGLHGEAEPAGDVLRIARGVREGDDR